MNRTKNKTLWFSLIEIILWILIFSIVMAWWFKALVAVNIWKIKLIEKTNIEKEAFYFSEKLFEMIKYGWTIDYEEYFNRKVIWNTTFSGWHFLKESWFWNFGTWTNLVASDDFWWWFYYCLSWDWTSMWKLWCFNNNFNNNWASLWDNQQRYGEYSLQFIDYNSNQDDDSTNCTWILWDEDCDWNFIWDDDDEYLWVWPSVFTWWENINEIYLINWEWKQRTFFRWNVTNDPNHPNSSWNCDFTTQETPTWSWCLWNIQFLKLDWKDWWMDHIISTNDNWEYDWIIDTWIYNKDFDNSETIAWEWSSSESKWVDLFPNTINISNFKVFAYPNKKVQYAWKDYLEETNISPYLRISFTMSPSRKKRKGMKWTVPEINISTTISLNDKLSN